MLVQFGVEVYHTIMFERTLARPENMATEPTCRYLGTARAVWVALGKTIGPMALIGPAAR